MPGALQGIRVVDFGQYLAGPLTAQLLSDQGADVIRVDPPTGPMWDVDANALLQRGKRSIALDLKTQDGQAIARRLIQAADVVVENFRPGVMKRLGLGADEMCAANPGLVYLSMPGFAADDPRSALYAHEGILHSAASLSVAQDFNPDVPPVYNSLPLASTMGGVMGATGVVAALIARERSGGLGQKIELPLLEAAFELARYYGEDVPGRKPPAGWQMGSSKRMPVATGYKCSDSRFVRVSWLEGRQVHLFAEKMGLTEAWEAEGLFEAAEHKQGGHPKIPLLLERISEVIATQPAQYWEDLLNPDCDLVVIRDTKEWLLYDAQARLTEAVITLIDPLLGVVHQAGYPVSLSRTPPRAQGARHRLDSDREDILAELDTLPPRPKPAPGNGAMPLKSVLEGYRALDLTVLLAGPTTCRTLTEYGAEVIQIANPNRIPNHHYQVHMGKRTMMLDLKKPGGRELFLKLAETSDIISTNFAQSVAERLGIDEAAIRKVRPDIIYSRVSAHGMVGPRKEWRGHEEVGQAVTGAMTRFGKDQDMPALQFFTINDMGTGQTTSFAIMLGLYHRLRTGEGQFVGGSLAQTCVLQQTPYMLAYNGKDWDEPGGFGYRGPSPLQQLYKGADNRWFFLAARPGQGPADLAAVAGLDGLDTVAADQLRVELARRFETAPARDWIDRLNAAGLSATLTNTAAEAISDPWVVSHGMVREVEFPHSGPGRIVSPTGRLSATPMRSGKPVAPVGWDGPDILGELKVDARDLIERGVVVVPEARLKTESALETAG